MFYNDLEKENIDWDLSKFKIIATNNSDKTKMYSVRTVSIGRITQFYIGVSFTAVTDFSAGNSIEITLPNDFPIPMFDLSSIGSYEGSKPYDGFFYVDKRIEIRLFQDTRFNTKSLVTLSGTFIKRE